MKNILVSACLLGDKCRYDGESRASSEVQQLKKSNNLIAVCPEVLGGLNTPRMPAEINNGKVIDKNGKDVTENFKAGAEKCLKIAKDNNCKTAILKAKSPSCGSGKTYDGTFSGKLINANGITAQLLLENGITVYTEENIDNFISENK